jgi:hypothetical protein
MTRTGCAPTRRCGGWSATGRSRDLPPRPAKWAASRRSGSADPRTLPRSPIYHALWIDNVHQAPQGKVTHGFDCRGQPSRANLAVTETQRWPESCHHPGDLGNVG